MNLVSGEKQREAISEEAIRIDESNKDKTVIMMSIIVVLSTWKKSIVACVDQKRIVDMKNVKPTRWVCGCEEDCVDLITQVSYGPYVTLFIFHVNCFTGLCKLSFRSIRLVSIVSNHRAERRRQQRR